jgi:ribonuclease Z
MSSSAVVIAPTPSIRDVNLYVPTTEVLGANEMRISFMGSVPFPPRRSQASMCIMVELGSAQRFFFDFGPGCLRNIIAMQVPIQDINDIFISHLHIDHFGDLPYLYEFAPQNGRWTPLRVTGPSGRERKFGTRAMLEAMQQMTAWNTESIRILPVGRGTDLEITEFDWRDDNGLCYDSGGVEIRHWRRSHTMDGASAYRLDWNGLAIVWTGDGRPDRLTIEYSRGVDVFVTEVMIEDPELIAAKWGYPADMANYIMDTHHTSQYAAGFLMNQVQPRMGVLTHFNYDPEILPTIVSGVRAHWAGPLYFGVDCVVMNLTKESFWVRRAATPDSAFNANPRALLSADGNDQPSIPTPTHTREELQDAETRKFELDPNLYLPEHAQRKLVANWPGKI